MRHFVDLLDWDAAELAKLLKEAARLKKAHLKGEDKPVLRGRVLGMIFEKPSLRTRISFQAAMAHLGGESVFLSGMEVGLGKRESLADVARTMSQFVDAIVLRTFHHDTVVQFAALATCPVINGLSDYCHPCQALGDLLTMQESFGAKLEGKTIAFVGDGNNVARSLALGAGKLGIRFVLSAPKGYGFDAAFLKSYRAAIPKGVLLEEPDPAKAVKEASVIYTDVWTSMGQEAEHRRRTRDLAPYRLDSERLAGAAPDAIVLHCLPAHYGEEVTETLLYGPQSAVWDQAENRLHSQKALLALVVR